MEVSFEAFYQVLKEKSILYFSLNYQGNPAPHYYVLLDKGTEILLFSVCTSKLDTILNFVKKRNLDYDTIVFIESEPDNPFSKNTYINCNSPVSIPYHEFKRMFEEGKVKYKDQLGDEHFDQIVNGILKSRLVERRIKKLFVKNIGSAIFLAKISLLTAVDYSLRSLLLAIILSNFPDSSAVLNSIE